MHRERPIIFGADSVRAILAGTKTQTRRVLRPCRESQRPIGSIPGLSAEHRFDDALRWAPETECVLLRDARPGWWWAQVKPATPEHPAGLWSYGEPCPYGVPGDRLWVRETWAMRHEADELTPAKACLSWIAEWYRADRREDEPVHRPGRGRWRSPRFMPRWASRLLLEITDVRVERLQAISEEDARAEGAAPEFEVDASTFVRGSVEDLTRASTHRLGFKHGWDEINARRGFPWESDPWVWAITFVRVDADEALAARLRAKRDAIRAAEEADRVA